MWGESFLPLLPLLPFLLPVLPEILPEILPEMWPEAATPILPLVRLL